MKMTISIGDIIQKSWEFGLRFSSLCIVESIESISVVVNSFKPDLLHFLFMPVALLFSSGLFAWIAFKLWIGLNTGWMILEL